MPTMIFEFPDGWSVTNPVTAQQDDAEESIKHACEIAKSKIDQNSVGNGVRIIKIRCTSIKSLAFLKLTLETAIWNKGREVTY